MSGRGKYKLSHWLGRLRFSPVSLEDHMVCSCCYLSREEVEKKAKRKAQRPCQEIIVVTTGQ